MQSAMAQNQVDPYLKKSVEPLEGEQYICQNYLYHVPTDQLSLPLTPGKGKALHLKLRELEAEGQVQLEKLPNIATRKEKVSSIVIGRERTIEYSDQERQKNGRFFDMIIDGLSIILKISDHTPYPILTNQLTFNHTQTENAHQPAVFSRTITYRAPTQPGIPILLGAIPCPVNESNTRVYFMKYMTLERYKTVRNKETKAPNSSSRATLED